MMTSSTSSAALEVLSAWRLWVWCSLMTCCRTWREASRPRSCGSASPWRWQPSLPEHAAQWEYAGSGPGLDESHSAPTQPPALLLPFALSWAHSCCLILSETQLPAMWTYIQTNTAHRQYNQLPYPSPQTSFFVCVHSPRAQRRSQVNFLLYPWQTLHSNFIMVHVCVTVELNCTPSFLHLAHLLHFP